MTAAMPEGTGLTEFARKFPERFFDVGIAEAHAVTFAAGLAAQGLGRSSRFTARFFSGAYDSLIHDVALQNLDVIFAIDRAGIVGADGPTHHGAFDLAMIGAVPESPRGRAGLLRRSRRAFGRGPEFPRTLRHPLSARRRARGARRPARAPMDREPGRATRRDHRPRRRGRARRARG